MQQTIYIDIWSDFVCPFCYIGKRSLEKAIEQSGLKENTFITWHSFLLDPEMNETESVSPIIYLADKKGISIERSVEMHAQLTERAAEFGLDYRFDIAKVAPTLLAHAVLQKAKHLENSSVFKENVMDAYFQKGLKIDEPEILKSLAIASGFTTDDAVEAVSNDDYKMAVWSDYKMAEEIGIRGVPFIIFQHKYAVSGAQNPEVFMEVLDKIKNEMMST